MITEEKIKKVLSEIIDPELGADIITLGFVKDIKIENGKVTIKLKLTIPDCPLMSFFLEEIKEKVKEIKGVSEVEVKLVN
jgi:ATP-binding protein involved in chromosome partitioning